LKYNYEANGIMLSTFLVNQEVVPYWRINIKPSKKLTWTINLVQHLCLDLNQERIDQVLLLSIEYIWKQLDHKKKVFKNKYIEDMKWCVRQDSSWRKINKDLATMNHVSEKSKRESWRQRTICDGEGQVVVPNFSKQISVSILWFASLCSCSPICLSNKLPILIL
jgi:hypothetical protein